MSQLFIDSVTELAKLNHNKFTAIEQLALKQLESKCHESLSHIDRAIRISKNADTEIKNSPEKMEDVRRYYSYILSSCEMMSSSFLLKPVKGHVIQRDRTFIAKYMEAAKILLEKHKISS